ncbi:MAG: hypothetical protein A3J40_02845 [Erythrobacter sp. RIFCSPHIGHO2_12_FULL_63_10]|nr:MAG: hypothetical protein A3J40_02845 [Erythrobacter sp. RIFCSPHIGHO2_12_FULL_63_10]
MTGGNSSDAAVQAGDTAASWQQLRADTDIQFAPVTIPDRVPREPGWLDRFFQWLGELLSPLGGAFGSAWPVVKWILLALIIGMVLLLLWRLIEPVLPRSKYPADTGEDVGWAPDETASLALLEDADRLAAQGRYDEATHLLLLRSISQIAAARPDWVEPSSTARELASLTTLPLAARQTFGLITERVERSLFALRALEQADWEAARTAYADFALTRLVSAR